MPMASRWEQNAVVWAAGVMASPAGSWLGVETDGVGRVKVNPDLSVPAHPEIFVIGDTSHCIGTSGSPLPGIAPVAKQQGEYMGRLKARTLGNDCPPFRYRDFGIRVGSVAGFDCLLRRSRKGDLVAVTSSAPNIGLELEVWCRFARNSLIDTEVEGDCTRWVLR
jgi:hypothetical protein